MIAYRKEIDGLRAIAVLSVIFFHAGFETFKGGFVGVDVFFVISGYLITSIILKEKSEGTFTLKRFYERRARRILPALFFVIFCTMPFAWFWLFPQDFTLYLQSILATIFFSANWFFALTSGYFRQQVDYYPLLHTWSLSLEEQFYIVYPIILLVVLKFSKSHFCIWFLLLLCVCGVGFAHYEVIDDSTATFYGFLSRGWTMVVGGMLPFIPTRKVSCRVKNVLSLIGIISVFYSIGVYSKATLYPSEYTLLPVIGTACVLLFADSTNIIGKILGTKILSGVGLISYSLYLWHQPVFAFARSRFINDLSVSSYWILIASVFCLSYVSWRFVETPFKNRDIIRKNTFICACLGSYILFIGMISFSLHSSNKKQFGDQVLRVLDVVNDKKASELCFTGDAKKKNFDENCVLGCSITKNALLFGDSHAAALFAELGKGLQLKKLGGVAFFRHGCAPVFGVETLNSNQYCPPFVDKAYTYLAINKVRTVVLVSRWTSLMQGNGFDNQEGGMDRLTSPLIPMIDGYKVFMKESKHRAYILNAYKETLQKLLQLKTNVILVYPIPEVGWDVPYYMAKKMYFEGVPLESLNVSTSYALYKTRHKNVIDMFDGLGEHSNLIRIYPDKILCNTYIKDRCVASLNGKPLYFDDDHLSNAGAKLVVDEIMKHIH